MSERLDRHYSSGVYSCVYVRGSLTLATPGETRIATTHHPRPVPGDPRVWASIGLRGDFLSGFVRGPLIGMWAPDTDSGKRTGARRFEV